MPTRNALLAAVLTAAVLSGCGSNQSDTVKAKVRQFASAVQSHDYATICDQVLAPQLLADITAGGLSCQRAMALGLGNVHGARLVIGEVKVSGNHASVQTLTQAVHEKTTVATLRLVDTSRGWRIASLGNPLS